MADQKEKRISRNLWVRPVAQLKILLPLSLGFLVISCLAIVTMVSFDRYLQTLQGTNQIDTQTIILVTDHLYRYLRLLIAVSLCFALLGAALGTYLSHRIYGPMVPIGAHIKRLIAGDYSGRIHLRSGDEFKDIARDLNVLVDRLNQNKN